MRKQKKCKCGYETVIGFESNVVRGSFDEEGVLLLKGYEPLGVQELKCENCGKGIGEDFEIEFV